MGAHAFVSLVFLALVTGEGLCVHLVFADHILVASKFKEVHVLVPEITVSAAILVPCHLIQNTKVSDDIVRVKLLPNLSQELHLFPSQLILPYVPIPLAARCDRQDIGLDIVTQLLNGLVPQLG